MTARQIMAALTERLALIGVKVADGQPVCFRVRFTEEPGETLPIFEVQQISPFLGRYTTGRDTGRTATEAEGHVIVELVAEGESKPIWRDSLNAWSARTFKVEINDATIRESMLKVLTGRIRSLKLPYFIPKSKDLLALPAVLD